MNLYTVTHVGHSIMASKLSQVQRCMLYVLILFYYNCYIEHFYSYQIVVFDRCTWSGCRQISYNDSFIVTRENQTYISPSQSVMTMYDYDITIIIVIIVCTGDHVVVVNASDVVFSGKKWNQKLYRHHTG